MLVCSLHSRSGTSACRSRRRRRTSTRSFSREITDLRKSLQIRPPAEVVPSRASSLWCQTQASRERMPAGGYAERFIELANQRKRLLYRARALADGRAGRFSGPSL